MRSGGPAEGSSRGRLREQRRTVRPQALTKQFQMSTHCQPVSPGARYGTFGTPIGIIVTASREPPPAPALRRGGAGGEDEAARRR